MIDRKFLFFKNRKTFEEKLRQGEINRKESIVFIEGETPADRAIWTHNVFYEPSTGLEHSKGFFESYQALYDAWPWPLAGDWAIVADDASIWVLGEEFPATLCEHVSGDWYIYTCPQNGKWVKSQRQYSKEDIDLSEYLKKDDIDLNQYITHNELHLDQYLSKQDASNQYATKSELQAVDNSKQDKLISGVNIATINNQSLLDNENIEIQSNTTINQIIGEQIDTDNFATKDDLDDYVKKSDIASYIISGTDIDIDTEGFVVREELDDYVKKNQLKTINGESLIGTGDIVIQGGNNIDIDLSQFVTKEQFENYNKILSVNITSVSPTLFEYTGQAQTITCGYTVKKGSDPIVPDTLTVNGGSLQPESSGTFTITHSTLGTKSIQLKATLGTEEATASRSATSVRPTYYGFSIESVAANVDLEDLTKTVIGSISMHSLIPNTVYGSYLWIVTQFNVNKVAVDENFTYTVAMEDPVTINGLKFYRSKQQIDVCELTYYIK